MRGVMRRAVGVLPSRAGTVIYPVQRLSELLNIHDPSKGRGHGTTMPVILPNKQQIRHFGVVDSLNLKIHNKKKDQNNELFNKQVQSMLKLEKFTIDDFANSIKEQTSSWTAKLPFVRSSDGVKEGKRVSKLVDAFTDEQKKKPTALNEGERTQLARMTEMSLADVDLIISNYENMETIFRWIKARQAKGQSIPTTMQALRALAMGDPQGVPYSKFVKRPKQKFARGSGIKWKGKAFRF